MKASDFGVVVTRWVVLGAVALGCSRTESTGSRDEPRVATKSAALVTTTSLDATGDTYLKSGSPNQNQGGDTVLSLQSSGKHRSLLFFGPSAIQAAVGTGTLISAKLELSIVDTGNNWGSGRPIALHRLGKESAEYGATWSCALDANVQNQQADCSGASAWDMGSSDPALQPWATTATATTVITSGQTGVISLDVTADVAALLAGTSAGHGFLLKKVDEGQNGSIEFASRELGPAPRLVLEVDGGPGTEPPGPVTGSASLPCSKDTYLRQGQPNQSFGSDPILRIQASGRNRTLIGFEESAIAAALGGELVTATLKLPIATAYDNWGPDRVLGAHRMLAGWSEAGATWNCATDADTGNGSPDCEGDDAWVMWGPGEEAPFLAAPTGTVLVSSGQTGALELDVTRDVACALAGFSSLDGWLLKKEMENQNGKIELSSRETPTPPELLIEWTDGAGVQVTAEDCGASGPPEECTPTAPMDTTCDGLDDDCDGAIDDDFSVEETTCGSGACAGTGVSSCVGGAVVDDCSFADPDDENVCTSDSCDAAGTPVYAPLGAGTSCADADVCNGDETCDGASACVPGTPPEVDDDNACTADGCDPEAGVFHDPVETGTSCADADLCNGDETCDPDGTCAPGTPPSVDDANPCTDDACEASGGVIHTAVAAGTSCSDGNACDGEESCDGAGSCQAGTPPEVDDGNPCTADGCDPSSGPTHVPVSAGTSCANGDACDGAEVCDGAGTCAPGAPPDLDDGNPCTADGCDPSGGPTHAPLSAGTSCSNGNVCDGAETCDGAGLCQPGTPVAVDDGNPCTADSCDPSAGPEHTPVADGSGCDDGDVCTSGDACVAGTCTPGADAADDQNPCTDDFCDPILGPQHVPLDEVECDDGNVCTGFDYCVQGICHHEFGEDLDYDGCTVDTCDPETGDVTFEPLPEGSACESVCEGYGFCESGFCEVTEPYPEFDDGDACTNEDCFSDNTITHEPIVPDDANPCTADSCDSETGAFSFDPLPEGTACEVNCQGSGTCDASATCDITEPPTDPDDGNPCTVDECDYFLGILHYPAAPGTSCDEDDNECNGTDTCDAAGVCQPGDPSDADDDNPCTVEECVVDPGTGAQTVVHTPLNEGDYCFDDDGDPCNGFNTCVLDFFDNLYCGGPGGPDDGNPCTIDTCDPVNGVAHEPAPIGSECEDGDPCTGAGACDEGGLCQMGQPIDIDDGDACTEDVCYSFDGTVTHDSIDPEDGNPCTQDACDPETGVSHTPAPSGTSCADFTVCNGAESCDGAGECQPGTPLLVDDGNPCTLDTCNIVLGVTHTPRPSFFSCGDGTFCNGAETCDGAGSCVPGTPPVVDDGNPCTSDSCTNLGNGAVFHTPRQPGASCSNGDACDGAETCSGSSAQCLPGTPPVIDDGNVCTVDSCDPELGPVHDPVATGTSCADADVCNGQEACDSSGTCAAGTPLVLDDGNACTADSCDPSTGVHNVPAADGTSCADADVCNGDEVCDAFGVCLAGSPLEVTDGNPCTSDTCDPSLGPVYPPVVAGTSCADADVCNGEEVCDGAGACTAATPLDPDDGNPCTSDSCDPSDGAQHAPVAEGTSCSDGDVCNGDEACDGAGICTAGIALDINDGNPCTSDACDALLGPTHEPLAAGASCADADVCNGDETCDGTGSCTPGTPLDIDDGDPCTADACDPQAGVQHSTVPDGTSCEDGDLCTFGDTCELGLCLGSDVQCPSGTFCDVHGVCIDVLPADAECNADNECNSTVCLDGLCCNEDNPSYPVVDLDPTLVSDFVTQVAPLYSGAAPSQSPVAPGAVDPAQVAVVTGRVLDPQGEPLGCAAVSVLDAPELGRTVTRSDGSYAIVVNGGGRVVTRIEHAGYVTAFRAEQTRWHDFAFAQDARLVPLGTPQPVSADAVEITTVSGEIETDEHGSRQATLLFDPGTLAFVEGESEPLDSFNVRVKEVTNLATGSRDAMPAELPPQSAFTYAVSLTLEGFEDERVDFDRPVAIYVENFLDFPNAEEVPVGYYDEQLGEWVASDNGRVIRIVGENASGEAEIDLDATAGADDPATLGIDGAERVRLAQLYPVGTSLWRVEIDHFSKWDANWGWGPVAEASVPNQPDPAQAQLSCPVVPQQVPGSIISCEEQGLGERVGVAGTPYDLVYSSARQPGGSPPLEIPLATGTVPSILRGIELEVEAGGRRWTYHYPPPSASELPLRHEFYWDGVDLFGRRLYGPQRIHTRVGYTYDGSYQRTSRFGYNGNGTAITASRDRFQATLWQSWWHGFYGQVDARHAGLAGWSIDSHHLYDPGSGKVYLGNGGTLDVSEGLSVLRTVAGTGTQGFSGDGGPAVQAKINLQPSLTNGQLAVGPDGTVYFADGGNNRIRKISTSGIITTVAGGGPGGSPYGDGGPATSANFDKPSGVAVDSHGRIYVTDKLHARVRMIDKDGIITTVAGNGTCCTYNGDGPALTRVLRDPTGVTVAEDGTVYFVAFSVFRLREGIVTKIAGTPTRYLTQVAVGPDNSIFYSDYSVHRIQRVSPNGVITTHAGTGSSTGNFPWGDGGPATSAPIDNPDGVAVGPDGLVYVVDTEHNQIRRVNTDGTIEAMVGNGTAGYEGEDQPALSTRLDRPRGVGLGPDGAIYVLDSNNNRIRKVEQAAPFSAGGGNLSIPSRDGRELFVFTPEGRHVKTLDTYTGITRRAFEYDSSGLLVGIADREITDPLRRTTVIERDLDGTATAIVAPDGQRTELVADAADDLRTITDPSGGVYSFDYELGGLLASMRDPKGNQETTDPYVFDYDNGRLVSDRDPLGNEQTLSHSSLAQGWRVTRSTPLGRVTTYDSERIDRLLFRQRTTGPDGLVTETSQRVDGTSWFLAPNAKRYSRFTSRPDRSFVYSESDPDPLFGMQAPVATERLDIMGTGASAITRVTQSSRSIVRSDDADPTSIISVTETQTVNGRTSVTAYDAATSTFTTTSPTGRQTFRTIDARGRTARTEVPGVLPIDFGYDTADRITEATQGTRLTTWTYDTDPGPTQGYLESMTNAAGHTTSYIPDELGRVLEETLGGATTGFDYDPNGNLTSVTPPGKPEHEQLFTPLNQLETYAPPPAGLPTSATGYSHDADRNPLDIFRPDAVTVHHTYDTAGRPDLVTFAGNTLDHDYYGTGTGSGTAPGRLQTLFGPYGVNLAFAYNGSLITSMTWSGTVSGSVSWLYDTDFRKTQETVTTASGSGFTNFGYDLDSLLTCASPTSCAPPGTDALQVTRDPQNGRVTTITLGTIVESLTYNPYGELATKTVTTSGTPLYSVEYDTPTTPRDQLGRVQRKLETVEGTSRLEEYGYDVRGRLTDTTVDGVAVFHQEYDDNGNRLSRSGPGGTDEGVYDDQDRLLSYGGWVFTWGANGEMESKTDTTTSETWLYQYDALGNLLRVDLPDGRVIEYLVDGVGRRVGKKVDGVLVKQWLYRNRLKPVAELDGSGALQARFVYGTSRAVPDYVVKSGITYRTISDHLGSPRLVVNVSTGAVAQRMRHDEWGRVLENTAPAFTPFGFAGGLYDPDTELVRFGARDYDAALGRWLSKEPLRFAGGRNFFVYAANDPANMLDPTGLDPMSDGCGGAPSYAEGGTEGVAGLGEVCGDPWVQDWCGGADSAWVPDSDPFGTTNWAPQCQVHDECYAECGSDKFDCDWELGHAMQQACREQGDPCEASGIIYFAAVTMLAESNYDAGQVGCMCYASGGYGK